MDERCEMCIDMMLAVICCTSMLLLPFVSAHAEERNFASKERVLSLKDEAQPDSQGQLENEMF